MRRPVIYKKTMKSHFLVLMAITMIMTPSSIAVIITARPGDNIQQKINGMKPGDELVLEGGTYQIAALQPTISGSPSAWLTIRGADGSTVILNNSGSWCGFLLRDLRFWKLINLEITGGGSTAEAIRIDGSCSDLVIENCHIHHVAGNGINAPGINSLERLVVRGCHIHHTAMTAVSHGEAMYLGRDDGTGPVKNCLIEGNWVHDMGGTQGDGIEIKANGTGNIVRDNVVYNTKYPCIIVWNTTPPRNIVEGNICWNSQDNTVQVGDHCLVRNNIFLQSRGASLSASKSTGKGLKVYNNVLYSSHESIRFPFFPTAPFSFANNIVDGPVAGGIPLGTIVRNYWKGTPLGDDPILLPPAYDILNKDGYPAETSYIDAGWYHDPDVPITDFNGTFRSYPPDIGAYEMTAPANSGWPITANFKQRISDHADADQDGLSDAWEINYFGSIHHPQATPLNDSDGDGMNVLQEYQAGTSPLSSKSRLSIFQNSFSGQNFSVKWASIPGKTYLIEFTTNFAVWMPAVKVTSTEADTTWIDNGIPTKGIPSHQKKRSYRIKLADIP